MMIIYECLIVHVSESYPTKVRSVALGSSQTISRIGAIIVPFLKDIVSKRSRNHGPIDGGRIKLLSLSDILPQTSRLIELFHFFTKGDNTAQWFPIAFAMILIAISFLVSLILPETFGTKLPNTFRDARELLR